ncbi:MAG: beta-ketoacyl synthase N-terminal-like domain-containing protein [Bacteroidota bacterium]
MLKESIAITALSSISPLGLTADEVWENYGLERHLFEQADRGGDFFWMAPLSQKSKKEITALRMSDSKYRNLDDSVLFALYASRNAIAQAGWKSRDNFGINMGSSRGATFLFERYYGQFLEHGKVSPLSSPTTTLGNISSWVAHDLKTQGPQISHSITCSTALHALLNGVAWIQGGMTDKFLVGGSEAPLTPFTLAQMKALKIYAQTDDEFDKREKVEMNKDLLAEKTRSPLVEPTLAFVKKGPSSVSESSWIAERSRSYPCRALDLSKTRNSMILGEGAGVACLERGNPKNSLAVIKGIGYATEVLEHNVSISTDAKCFQRSMQMALEGSDYKKVDVIVMHAPGTVKGDSSEYKAIQKLFRNNLPFLTTNKWKIGHTFGASGMLSVEMAIGMLKHQEVVPVPFSKDFKRPSQIRNVMVNAVGFGGNAVSILLSA